MYYFRDGPVFMIGCAVNYYTACSVLSILHIYFIGYWYWQ